MSIVTLTGHRPYGLDKKDRGNMKIKKWLFEKVLATVQKHRKVHFISGGALGVDT
ncbi:hypothetical protein ACQKKK_03850 [Peribacillus sp. NPDC006672]|uniref:hypothetical protein n=1 Tax=Peribacillus sp. NPDC006672 TaxID=3390606 RepID=UPI003CFC1159